MQQIELDYAGDSGFTGIDFSDRTLDQKEYENCTFTSCIFSGTKILSSKFESVKFVSCNLSNTDFTDSRLIDVEFVNCKLIGLALFKCRQSVFDLRFVKSRIEYCNFSDVSMKRCVFDSCDFRESWFQNTFLVESRFTGCVFNDTRFDKCDLKKASFLDSTGYVIDPRDCKIQHAVFSVPGVFGLLDEFEIYIQ